MYQKIKNGKWYSSFVCNNCCNGKQIRTVLQEDKKLSKLLEAKIKLEHLSGQYKKEEKRHSDLIEVLETYKNTMDNISPSQMKTRQRDIIKLLKISEVDSDGLPVIGATYKNIKDITPADCINYMAQFKHLQTNTVNCKKAYLKSFFKFCVDMRWLDTNPAQTLKRERNKSAKQRRYFTSEELERVMDNAGEHKEFWTFLLETGIRCTDVFCLSTDNFKGNWCKWFENKNKVWINIPLNDRAMEIVNTKKGMLFPQYTRDNISATRYARRKIAEHLSCLVPGAVNHTFRHTFAQNAGNNGVSKEVLQRLLGHRSVKTTEIYFNEIGDDALLAFVNNQ